MERKKNPQNSSSSNNRLIQISELKFLPPEIWTEILSKLPAKTLLKLRCVCKSWCSLIYNPNFIHVHLQLSQIPNLWNNNKSLLTLEFLYGTGRQTRECMLTVRHAETLQETGLIFRVSDLYHIMGTCNGLLLVSYRKELRLWNPCIRKSLVIPVCPLMSLVGGHDIWVYVFGYAPVSKDYKVVAIAAKKGLAGEDRKIYVAVYTLRDQQWTIRNDGLNFSLPNTVGLGLPFLGLLASVFLKGVAYWLGSFDNCNYKLTHLGSFDFDKEEISFVELPSSWDNRGSCRLLFLFRESLAIFVMSEIASSIWVLDHDNKKWTWTQIFSGKSSRDGCRLLRYSLRQKTFFCDTDGGYFICGDKSYNIASCEMREFKDFKNFYLHVEMYSESLVLSNTYGARDLKFSP